MKVKNKLQKIKIEKVFLWNNYSMVYNCFENISFNWQFGIQYVKYVFLIYLLKKGSVTPFLTENNVKKKVWINLSSVCFLRLESYLYSKVHFQTADCLVRNTYNANNFNDSEKGIESIFCYHPNDIYIFSVFFCLFKSTSFIPGIT